VVLSTVRRSGRRSAGLRGGVTDGIITRCVAGPVIWVVAANLVVVPAEAGTHVLEPLRAEAGTHVQQEGPSPAASQFEALRDRAERARADGRLDDAMAAYGEAVILQPSWIEGHWYLGTMYYETGRFRECRDAFGRVVSVQLENGAAWAFKGLCEFQVKDYASATAPSS
jgi:tetratricopeptide (TPR) repeat protein